MANGNQNQTYMSPDKAITGSQAAVYVTYNDTNERFCFGRLIKLEAKAKLNKTALPILGRTGKAHKIGSWEGEGSATMYYCDSTMREKVAEYKSTGKMFTMDIEVYNDDKSSSMTQQIVTLKNCLLDELIIAKVDTEAEYLDEDISFTFDDYSVDQTFEERR